MRIRHFGLFANRCKKDNIALCLKLLEAEAEESRASRSVEEIMLDLTGNDIRCCPLCKKGILERKFEIKKFLYGMRRERVHKVTQRKIFSIKPVD